MNDLSVIIPVFNEDPKILNQIQSELESLGAEVIVVDDGSVVPYPKAIKHGTNFGYGSALMTGIKNATRPLVMTADGDGQHAISEIVKLYHAFKLIPEADMLIGARRLKSEKWHRYFGRKFLNWTASCFALYWLPDLNSGMRMFKRDKAIGYFPILCRRFSFTTSITLSFICDGLRVEWFPIEVRPRTHGSSTVNVTKDGFITLWYILKIGFALRTRGIRKVWRACFHR